MWTFIIIVVSLLGVGVVVMTFAGNWRVTLNQVISQYISWRQMEPNYTEEEIFKAVLDHRYPYPNKDVGGLLLAMHQRKNPVLQELKEEIEAGNPDLKYNLPTLIYAALVIEQNSYIFSKRFKSTGDVLGPITAEVKRQGLSKYI